MFIILSSSSSGYLALTFIVTIRLENGHRRQINVWDYVFFSSILLVLVLCRIVFHFNISRCVRVECISLIFL